MFVKQVGTRLYLVSPTTIPDRARDMLQRAEGDLQILRNAHYTFLDWLRAKFPHLHQAEAKLSNPKKSTLASKDDRSIISSFAQSENGKQSDLQRAQGKSRGQEVMQQEFSDFDTCLERISESLLMAKGLPPLRTITELIRLASKPAELEIVLRVLMTQRWFWCPVNPSQSALFLERAIEMLTEMKVPLKESGLDSGADAWLCMEDLLELAISSKFNHAIILTDKVLETALKAISTRLQKHLFQNAQMSSLRQGQQALWQHLCFATRLVHLAKSYCDGERQKNWPASNLALLSLLASAETYSRPALDDNSDEMTFYLSKDPQQIPFHQWIATLLLQCAQEASQHSEGLPADLLASLQQSCEIRKQPPPNWLEDLLLHSPTSKNHAST